jgi:hypothetical protein
VNASHAGANTWRRSGDDTHRPREHPAHHLRQLRHLRLQLAQRRLRAQRHNFIFSFHKKFVFKKKLFYLIKKIILLYE